MCFLDCQLFTSHILLLTLLFSIYRFLCDGHTCNCGVSVRKDPVSVPKTIHSLDDSVICVYKVVRLRPRHLICDQIKITIEDKINDLFFWKCLLLILPEVYCKTVTLWLYQEDRCWVCVGLLIHIMWGPANCATSYRLNLSADPPIAVHQDHVRTPVWVHSLRTWSITPASESSS